MLYLLTGEIQTGKTRWLEARMAQLEAAGVDVRGVLSPGVWVPGAEGGFEKLGIDLVFYPGHERVRFADRLSPDEVSEVDEDGYGDEDDILTGVSLPGEVPAPAPVPVTVAGKVLGWKFYPFFFGKVNGLFTDLRGDEPAEGAAKRLVVLDEIGRMELVGRGFTDAMAFLADGENPAWPHVVAVVRSELLQRAWELLAPSWGDGMRIIHPDEEGERALFNLFG